jgi:hypothetical protein
MGSSTHDNGARIVADGAGEPCMCERWEPALVAHYVRFKTPCRNEVTLLKRNTPRGR